MSSMITSLLVCPVPPVPVPVDTDPVPQTPLQRSSSQHFTTHLLFAVKKYRGSYMSAHVLLNLLNELGKKEIKCEALRYEFNKFNKTRARMLDSIYHMTLRIL